MISREDILTLMIAAGMTTDASNIPDDQVVAAERFAKLLDTANAAADVPVPKLLDETGTEVANEEMNQQLALISCLVRGIAHQHGGKYAISAKVMNEAVDRYDGFSLEAGINELVVIAHENTVEMALRGSGPTH